MSILVRNSEDRLCSGCGGEIPQGEMSKVIDFCKENHITKDYYMWEFMTWEHEE